MRISRTDLVPVLTTMAGGAFGVLITASLLVFPPAADLPAPGQPVWSPDGSSVVFESGGNFTARVRAPMGEALPDGRWIASQSGASGEPRFYMRVTEGNDGKARMAPPAGGSFRPSAESNARPLIYVDGVRIGTSIESLHPDDIENIEIVKGAAAVERYGAEASAGVILISLKEARDRR